MSLVWTVAWNCVDIQGLLRLGPVPLCLPHSGEQISPAHPLGIIVELALVVWVWVSLAEGVRARDLALLLAACSFG